MSGSLAEDVFGKKQEQKEAERTKPESKTASPSENSSSFGKKELINIFKGAVTIGLTAGFPPAGWALSLGFLYLTKNWGKDSEKDKEKLEEFESKMQQVKDMGTKTKAATAAVAQETTTENMQASENLAAANQTENQQSAANLAPVNQEELQAGAVGSEQETSPENQQAAATNLDSAAQPNSQAAGATQETAKTTTNLDGALGESGETTNESASNNRATAMSEAGAAVKKATSEQESSEVENINTATTGKAQGGGGIDV